MAKDFAVAIYSTCQMILIISASNGWLSGLEIVMALGVIGCMLKQLVCHCKTILALYKPDVIFNADEIELFLNASKSDFSKYKP
jgi:hypothetical protein